MPMQKTTFIIVVMLLLRAAAPAAADNPVSLTVVPDPVIIVPGENAQQLSLDFLVKNSGPVRLEFESVVLTAFDGKGALVTRLEINRLGMCPSIALLPFTAVEPGKTVIAFNPFQELPPGLELKTLKFAFTFTAGEGGKKIAAMATVRPVLHAAQTPLSLPVKGKVIVWDGWDFNAHHRRLDLAHPMMADLGVKHNITRFGIDFMQVDGEGSTCASKGERLEDYYIFAKPVLAPAAGLVVDCVAERPDSPIGQMLVDYEALQRTKDLRLLGGNYVVMDHGNGEFSFLCHMRQNSLKVRKGDRVKAGQQIGEVGSSGDSAEPHLHYQLRSSANPDCESLPAEFRDFRRWQGTRSVMEKRGYVNSGDIIENI